jgi:hypothetical protein
MLEGFWKKLIKWDTFKFLKFIFAFLHSLGRLPPMSDFAIPHQSFY